MRLNGSSSEDARTDAERREIEAGARRDGGIGVGLATVRTIELQYGRERRPRLPLVLVADGAGVGGDLRRPVRVAVFFRHELPQDDASETGAEDLRDRRGLTVVEANVLERDEHIVTRRD